MRKSEVRHLGPVISKAEHAIIMGLRASTRPSRLFAAAMSDLWLDAMSKRRPDGSEVRIRKTGFCVHTLTKGRRCRRWDCRIPGEDHASLLLYNGLPKALMLEPYQLGFDEMKALVAFCEEHGLRVWVDSFSPYNPGNTIRIMLCSVASEGV